MDLVLFLVTIAVKKGLKAELKLNCCSRFWLLILRHRSSPDPGLSGWGWGRTKGHRLVTPTAGHQALRGLGGSSYSGERHETLELLLSNLCLKKPPQLGFPSFSLLCSCQFSSIPSVRAAWKELPECFCTCFFSLEKVQVLFTEDLLGASKGLQSHLWSLYCSESTLFLWLLKNTCLS